ncbi:hypothetical protein BATDEDRAFT_87744 [Batrachochytrium dendrobatidis JAM81]|uniref:BZIP domain-containing protein n=1 Tax=Batrachochytrium dendrobatidis (strain JAM81 / FGSC 10211) TaxID=684364 RepID=F4NZJ3_BATDJ|nr:uncharacterized protein BATDEDRAFT_87744 [Batrachochytrium dendrobatidis JAM81]EGF81452.1 hypothetical protein BATDEDRAFT_87744 [Batrachochytrium dendrobatidis JAM81]|eukprot:XP_006678209.1 hypothetical protein BATDEDRAFT_87744 [Batrachochytrium dendrobatidis JAM81]
MLKPLTRLTLDPQSILDSTAANKASSAPITHYTNNYSSTKNTVNPIDTLDDDTSVRAESESVTETPAPTTKKRKQTSKRAEQNRAAQRAFRERKDRYTKELEEKLLLLEIQYNAISGHNNGLKVDQTEDASSLSMLTRSTTKSEDESTSNLLDQLKQELAASNTQAATLLQERDRLIQTVDQLQTDIKLLHSENQRLRSIQAEYQNHSHTQGHTLHSSARHHLGIGKHHPVHVISGSYRHGIGRDDRLMPRAGPQQDMQHFTVKGGAGFITMHPPTRRMSGVTRPVLEWSAPDSLSRTECVKSSNYSFTTSGSHLTQCPAVTLTYCDSKVQNPAKSAYVHPSHPSWVAGGAVSSHETAPSASVLIGQPKELQHHMKSINTTLHDLECTIGLGELHQSTLPSLTELSASETTTPGHVEQLGAFDLIDFRLTSTPDASYSAWPDTVSLAARPPSPITTPPKLESLYCQSTELLSSNNVM